MVEDEELARECRLNVGKLRPELAWSQTIAPLDQFCSDPRRSPDKMEIRPARRPTPARRLTRLPLGVVNAFKDGGVDMVAARVREFLGTRMRPRP